MKEKARDLGEEFQQFADVKMEFKKYGLEISDLAVFAETVKKAQELGFDAQLIGSKLRYWDKLEKKEQDHEEKILELERKKEILEHQVGYDDSG